MKKYHIEMEVITPLSVGAGNDNEWAVGCDFVQKDGKVYVLDIAKAVEQGFDIEVLSNLFLRSDDRGICQLLGNKLEQCSKYIFQSPIYTNNSIKPFLRTQLYDRPVVAGSSLKGSVRSALFKHFRSPNETDNVSVFGTMNNGTDFMRFIQVSDFEMPSTILVNTKLFNLRKEAGTWQGGWKHKRDETTETFRSDGFNTLYECVEPHSKGFGSLAFDDHAFDLLLSQYAKNVSHLASKQSLMQNGIQELFHIINNSTRDYLQKEKAFFERYRANRSEELIDCIDYLLSMIPDDDSCCLIKMSAGVGFHSIIGDWKYEDYTQTGVWESGKNFGKQKYKSRKTAEYKGQLQLMGFVKLRCLNKDEATRNALQLEALHQTMIKDILTPINERETARLRALEEEKRKLEEQKAEKQRRSDYLQLIQEAESLGEKEQWDEAIAKAEEAAEKGFGYTEHISLIDRYKKEKELEQYKQDQKGEEEQKFKQPLAVVLEGKTSVGNIIGTTAKWLKFGHVFGEQEYQVLVTCLKAMPQKDIKKKRNDLSKAVGKEWSDKMMQELKI